MLQFVLIPCFYSLSYRCEYEIFEDISKTHFLYKEDNLNQVKWLEKIDYCKAKGDPSVYKDAGQGKCEYSRGLCYWDNSCLNTFRENDDYQECMDIFFGNELVEGLDNGRMSQQLPEQTVSEQQLPEQTVSEQQLPEQTECPFLYVLIT